MTSLPLNVAHSRHIQKATELLEGILNNPEQESQNRSDMRRIMDALSHTGISLGHFLIAYNKAQNLSIPPPSPITEKYQCPSCKENFNTASALSGHGPKRCAKRKEVQP